MSTTDKPTWQLAEKICEVPAVDEAIRTFVEDNTGDNAIGLVLAVLEHQAATEAAKATGTAGDLPPLPEAWITDCTTTDPAARLHFAADQMRTYGQACAEAARQPAPVVDDEAPKRVIDYITAFDKRLIGRGFDHAQRMEIVGLLVSKETQDAALAATAAPVLSDEQILANETLKYYFGLNGGKGPVSDKGHNIIQAVLTVATRSQP